MNMNTTAIHLTNEEVEIFKKFRQHQQVIGYIIGHLDTLNTSEMTNTQIIIDIDSNSNIGHVAITKHFRK